MSRRNKLITALLSIVLCFSMFTFTAFAVGEEEGGGDVTPDPVVTSPEYPVEQPTEAYNPVVPVETAPIPQPVEPETVTESQYTESVYDPDYEDPGYSYNDNSSYSEIYYDSDNGGESSEFYVGGGQSYVVPESTAPSVPLYESKHKIDDSVLSNNDWKDISASLKNADSGDDSDSDDFGFIKNNDSLNDNGEWMLYSGIACLALSAAGIAYVIISAVNKRKKLSNRLSGKQYAYAGAGGNNGRYSSSSYYGDGYKDSKFAKKNREKSRKYDTAEVNLPKSSNRVRYKNSGKRYK